MEVSTDFISILKISIIFALLISGSFFMIKTSSNPSITGAVIGPPKTPNYLLHSISLFMLALTLAYYWEYKKNI